MRIALSYLYSFSSDAEPGLARWEKEPRHGSEPWVQVPTVEACFKPWLRGEHEKRLLDDRGTLFAYRRECSSPPRGW